MNEDYCDYKLSLALKTAGFDEPCQMYYTHEDDPDGQVWLTGDPRNPENHNGQQDDCPFAKPICSAPTLWQAQKWLREKHHLLVNISTDGERSWTTNINGWNKEDIPVGYLHPVNVQTYDTYEQALSAGIAAALKLIKKGV